MAYPSEILGDFRNHYRLCARGLCGTAIRWIERLSAERISCGPAGAESSVCAQGKVIGVRPIKVSGWPVGDIALIGL